MISDSDAEMVIGGLVTCFAILIVGLCLHFGYLWGHSNATQEWGEKTNAVILGNAEFSVDDNGNTIFEWKDNRTPTESPQ